MTRETSTYSCDTFYEYKNLNCDKIFNNSENVDVIKHLVQTYASLYKDRKSHAEINSCNPL